MWRLTSKCNVTTRLCIWIALLVTALNGCSGFRHRAAVRYVAVANGYFTKGMYAKALFLYEKAIDADPLCDEAYYRAGVSALKLQHWNDAARYLQRAITLRPDRLEAYTQLANLYLFAYSMSNQNMQAAILRELQSLSRELHARFCDSYDDIRVKGYLALFSNDNEAARTSFEKANRMKPHQGELVLAYIQTLIASGQLQAAEALANDAIPNEPATARIYDVLAAHYAQAAQPEDVERILRLEITRNPKIADGYLELAAYYFSVKRWPEMTRLLNLVGNDMASFPFGFLQAGDFYLRVHDLTHAREWYQRGIDHSGKYKSVYQKRLVEVLVKQNRISDAQQVISDVLKGNSNDPEAIAIRASLSVLADNKQDNRTAISDFRLVLRLLPEDYVLRYLYGRALVSIGNVEEAAAQFEESIRLRHDYVRPRIALALLRIDTQEYGRALVIINSLITDAGVDVPYDTAGQRPEERPSYASMLHIMPDDAVGLKNLARKVSEAGIGAVDDALALAQRARQQLPDDDDLTATLALIYIQKNLPDTAIPMLRTLVRRDPNRAIYRYRLAQALLEKGDKIQARRECEAAMQRATNDEELRNIRELMLKLV